ncbi:MAG: hypothetical protein MMC33_007342 [Icmadophila ericetorum]|nr:hypothetical protein [Icmadophila ericetorum]
MDRLWPHTKLAIRCDELLDNSSIFANETRSSFIYPRPDLAIGWQSSLLNLFARKLLAEKLFGQKIWPLFIAKVESYEKDAQAARLASLHCCAIMLHDILKAKIDAGTVDDSFDTANTVKYYRESIGYWVKGDLTDTSFQETKQVISNAINHLGTTYDWIFRERTPQMAATQKSHYATQDSNSMDRGLKRERSMSPDSKDARTKIS